MLRNVPSGLGLRLLASVGLLSSTSAVLRAQDNTSRHGFWAGLTIGGGSGWFSGDTSSNTLRGGGWGLTGSLGWTPNPHTRLGGEFRGWQHGLSTDKAPITFAVNALVSYYPRNHRGPFIDVGAGLMNYTLGKGTGDPLESVSKDVTYNSGTGWGFAIGAGWDIPWMPRLTYAYGIVGSLHDPSGTLVATGWKTHQLLLDVGFRGWK